MREKLLTWDRGKVWPAKIKSPEFCSLTHWYTIFWARFKFLPGEGHGHFLEGHHIWQVRGKKLALSCWILKSVTVTEKGTESQEFWGPSPMQEQGGRRCFRIIVPKRKSFWWNVIWVKGSPTQGPSDYVPACPPLMWNPPKATRLCQGAHPTPGTDTYLFIIMPTGCGVVLPKPGCECTAKLCVLCDCVYMSWNETKIQSLCIHFYKWQSTSARSSTSN